MKAIILAAVLVSIAACASVSQLKNSPPLVEIDTLLSDPGRYHKELVRVRGAARTKFEAYFICPTPEAMENWGGNKKCLALVTGGSADASFYVEQLDGKIVEITGRFDAERFGHMGAYGGTISAVSARTLGSHNMRESPPPPPPPPPPPVRTKPSASSPNNLFKPMPLRGTA